MRCSTILVSWTVPTMSPATTSVPSTTVGSKVHLVLRSRFGTCTPRTRKSLAVTSWKRSKGRWIPSNICEIKPGPNSTERGAPVVTTGSPGPTPDVSSYTWIDASSRRISIISPINPRSPTRQISWILASCIPDATTKGPETLIIFP